MTKARDIADLGSNDVLDTTASGIDVTGSVTADGLTVDGSATISNNLGRLTLSDSDVTNQKVFLDSNGGSAGITAQNNTLHGSIRLKRYNGTDTLTSLGVGSNGDITMYKDDGSTVGVTFDASTGFLGIGGSPASSIELDVIADAPSLQLSSNNASGRNYGLQSTNDGKFAFYDGTAGLNRVIIDNSGNLLVGKASTGSSIRGSELRDGTSGFVATFKTDGDGICIDRSATADNGEFIRLRRDGSTVGLIEVSSNDNLNISATTGGGSGLQFWGAGGASPVISPMKEGNVVGGEVNLGRGTEEFNNLYLTGGVFIGGAGTANYLDEYEEGTLTMTSFSVGSGLSDVSHSYAIYTKIGSLVHIQGRVNITPNATGRISWIMSSPFNQNANSSTGQLGTLNAYPYSTDKASGYMIDNSGSNANAIYCETSISSTSASGVSYSLTYRTA